MLMVSDLIELARSGGNGGDLTARTPARFAPAGRKAPVVVWNVCRHCNQSCPHCYAAASKRPSPRDLTTEEAHRVVDDLADSGVRILIFSGGEPLLRGDLMELIGHATERGMASHLSTNGTLVDADVAARLAAVGVRYVGVSIDGVPRFNDAYRGMVGGFQRAAAGLRNAREAGMKTGLRMTITRRNGDQVRAMLDHARELSVDRFYVSHLVYAGRGKNLVADDLSPRDARFMLLELFRMAEANLADERAPRIVTGGNDSDGALLCLWLELTHGPDAASRIKAVLEQRGGNSAGEGIVCIDDRGEVHPDQFWRSESFGNVKDRPFAEILRHPLVDALKARSSLLTGRCAECPFLRACRGSHRERALASSGSTWAPDPSCVLGEEDLGAARIAGGVS